MARILKGDVYWADLNPVRGRQEAGLRPVLIISHEVFNTNSGTVIALAITSRQQHAGFPLALRLESLRLPKPSWVKISQIRTISTERIGRRLGAVSTEELARVIDGLFELVG